MVRERRACVVAAARSSAISTRRKGVRSVKAPCDSNTGLDASASSSSEKGSCKSGVRRKDFDGKLSHASPKPNDARISACLDHNYTAPAELNTEEVKCKSPRLSCKAEEAEILNSFGSHSNGNAEEPVTTLNSFQVVVNGIKESTELPAVKVEPAEDKAVTLLCVEEGGAVSVDSPLSPPTPHKIQLLEEIAAEAEVDVTKWPLTPSSALSKLKISAASHPASLVVKSGKARRRLNPNQSQNQVGGDSPTVTNTTAPKKMCSNNHKLTEFFPVRRSVRKTKKTILEEKQRTLEECILSGKEDGLMVKNFVSKGRGVVTTRHFKKGEFVVEYSGELVPILQAKERELKYAQDQNTGCYMYYFQYQNQPYCVDATSESGRLGRLVNHSRYGNLVTKTISINGKPHLILIAKRDISTGEELCYDYGDRSKTSLQYHPWLAS